jgi:hypothetical protein
MLPAYWRRNIVMEHVRCSSVQPFSDVPDYRKILTHTAIPNIAVASRERIIRDVPPKARKMTVFGNLYADRFYWNNCEGTETS